jgi:sulfur-carrier protein
VDLVTLRYWAGLRAAAGMAEEEAPGRTVAEVLDAARARHDDRFTAVLAHCSVLLDGTQVHDPEQPVTAGTVLDCLPPYAGG